MEEAFAVAVAEELNGIVLAMHADVDLNGAARHPGHETFGSPDIGWVRVVVDSLAGRIVAFEPRLQPGWRFW